MPKPPSTAGLSLTQVYGSVAEELKRRIGDAQAAQAGPPTSEEIVPATNEALVNAWNARDPAATDEAMLQLAQKKYQEHIQAGKPADVAQRATAEDLTHFRYGQRLKLYTYGQTDFKSQVEEAKRIAKLAARPSTPNPPMPPPSMPTAALTNLTAMGAPLPPAQPPIVSPALAQKLPEMSATPLATPGLPGTGQNGAPPPPPTAGGY